MNALDIKIDYFGIPLPDPGMNAGLQTNFGFGFERILADQPFGVSEVRPSGEVLRKYPIGDWMTSPQWFEDIEGTVHSQSLIDAGDDQRGVLILHPGLQQWFADENGLRCLVNMYDPWDEKHFRNRNDMDGSMRFRIVPRGKMTDAQRWRLAQENLNDPVAIVLGPKPDEPLPSVPASFAPIEVTPDNVCVTAFYREEEGFSGRDLESYAGTGMGHPYVLRLVEMNGEPTQVELWLPGTIAKALKSNLMGEVEAELPTSKKAVNPKSITQNPKPFDFQTLSYEMRAHEIATLYLDLVPGRKQARDLDAKREVWATVHRVDEE